MKNPFPGMNPYLEDRWQDVHASLNIYIRDQLEERLPPDLAARAEAHVAIEEDGQQTTLRPDVKIVEKSDSISLPAASPAESGGGPGIIVAEPLIVLVEPDMDRWIEIVDADGRLITVIEVLSPTNKSDDGQFAYRRRRRTYMSGGVNLVEIDLLRRGRRVVAIPPAQLTARTQTPYLVCVYRAADPEQRELYPLPLRERLPAIRVPLRRTDQDAVLDLQPLVDQCFERGRYWMLNYRQDLQPALSPEDSGWADELLRKAGLR